MNHDANKLRDTRKKPPPVRATVHITEQPDRPMTQEEVVSKKEQTKAIEEEVTKQTTAESLEQQIAQALTNPDVASADLDELISKTEEAVADAAATAQAEREKALDPIASPDAAKAEQSVWAAELRRDRLRSSLVRLWERLNEIERVASTARWKADYDAVKAKRDILAKEFAELYPTLTAQLCDLFERAKLVDRECVRIDGEAPAAEHRRLRGIELTARGLECFNRSSPSLTGAVTLPDWTDSARMVWPPPKIPLSVQVAASIAPQHDPQYSGDWAAARAKDGARRAANEARWAKEEEARKAESRRAYEASLRR
jgi:hypothetical protein